MSSEQFIIDFFIAATLYSAHTRGYFRRVYTPAPSWTHEQRHAAAAFIRKQGGPWRMLLSVWDRVELGDFN